MNDVQLKLSWRLYQEASELPPDRQLAYIRSSTGDPAVMAAVLKLLDEEKQEGSIAAEESANGSDPDQLSGRIGSQIGPFRILELIGCGGMGEVYSARDTVLGRVVALKLLRQSNATDHASIQRHVREAKAVSSLNHPNIVSVYQVVENGLEAAIAMELVEGNSLRRLMGNPTPVEHVCHFGSQAAQALAAAHRQGLIHRDIKPENLMVRPDGYVKVLDFGLARDMAAHLSTTSAIPVGTLRYMSPEQTRGESLTGATDIFSLGLVLYELATGRHPFPSDSAFETAHAIANRSPAPPSTVNKFIPQPFDDLILRMLSKSPDARPSAQDVADQLVRVMVKDHAADLPPKATRSGRKTGYWVSAATVVLVLIGAAVWKNQSGSQAISLRAVDQKYSELVLSPGPDSPVPRRYFYGVRPDGSLLVYVDESGDEGGNAKWIAQSVLAPPLAGANLASFAQVIGGSDGVLYGIAKDGSVTYFRLLDPWRNQGPMRWTPDSNTVIGKLPADFAQVSAFSRPVWQSDGQEHTAHAATIRGGLLWIVDKKGRTSLFQHGWANDGSPTGLADVTQRHGDPLTPELAPRWRGPSLPAGDKCRNCVLLEGGSGVFYALQPNGDLMRYRNVAGDESFAKSSGRFAHGPFAAQVGHTWNVFQTVAAGPGEYGIEAYVLHSPDDGRSARKVTLSVEAGQTVGVRVSTFSPAFTVRLLRLERRRKVAGASESGLVDGVPVGAEQTFRSSSGQGFKKNESVGMNNTGAGWKDDGVNISVPRNALSGIYAAELTTPSGGRFLAPFVVKPPASRRQRIAVIANTVAWNAHNQWGGGSRLASFHPVPIGQPHELSFDRPILGTPLFGGPSESSGLGDRSHRVFNQLARSEVWFTSYLDRLVSLDPRYAYDVYTDLDLDQGIANLHDYAVLALQGRPQYWTDSMRDKLDEYLAAGGHLIYAGTHGLMERVSISPAGKLLFRRGAGASCAVEKKDDRNFHVLRCPSLDLFRQGRGSGTDGRSERAVLGLAHELGSYRFNPAGRGYFVAAVAHPFLTSNTGLAPGAKFGNVKGLSDGLMATDGESNGHYSRGVCPETPGGNCGASHTTLAGKLLAFSEPNSGEAPITAASIVYRKTGVGSGWVFSIGSGSLAGVLAVDPTVQRILQNALDSGLNGHAPPEP